MIIQVLKSFFECFSRFQDKLNVDYEKIQIYDSDSDDEINWIDSDSDHSGVDSDDILSMFRGY